jgi:uncharacterized integral membrane protein
MNSKLKKIIFNFLFNISLFILLMISIQNSFQKRQVKLLLLETINLPISFIIGTSFISGTLLGSFISELITNDSDYRDNK